MRIKRMMAIGMAACMAVSLAACGNAGNEKGTQSESGAESVSDAGSGQETALQTENAKEAKKKSETVLVTADASGKVQETTVKSALMIEKGTASIRDHSDLKGIRNTDGDETFVQEEDGTVYWENLGKTIYYKGNTSRDIPVDVKVTYYLDGKEKQPDQMKGVTGDVKIRFDYTNKEKAAVDQTDAPVPFAVMSVLTLPEDVFSEIEVSDGNVMAFDGQQVVLGTAFPGVKSYLESGQGGDLVEDVDLPDHIEVSAHAENFELESTETIVVSGLFEKLEDDSLDNVEELSDKFHDLKDASAKLVDGASKLSSGNGSFQDALEKYVGGVKTLDSGIEKLSAGLDKVTKNNDTLKNGAKSMNDGLAQLQKTIKQYQAADDGTNAEMLATLSAYVSNLQKGGKNLSSGLDSYTEGVSSAAKAAAGASKGTSKLSESGDEMLEGYSSVITGANSLKNGLSKLDQNGNRKLADKGDDLSALARKLKALRKADEQYDNFGGKTDDTDGSVMFLIETEGIEED